MFLAHFLLCYWELLSEEANNVETGTGVTKGLCPVT